MGSNWKCKIGKHDWLVTSEELEYQAVSFPNKKMTLETSIRTCQRCYKKQRLIPGKDWVDYNKLNIKEIRDKKINEILN
jgi:hypothetical protein